MKCMELIYTYVAVSYVSMHHVAIAIVSYNDTQKATIMPT